MCSQQPLARLSQSTYLQHFHAHAALGSGEQTSDCHDSQIRMSGSTAVILKCSPNKPFHTYMYMCTLTPTGMYALYFHTTELSNGQLFNKLWSYQVTFFGPVCGYVESKWTWQWFDSENGSIWIEEDSGNDKLDEGRDQETEEERIRWCDRGADGKIHKGDGKGYIRTDNLYGLMMRLN